jgi:hypothetical protein
MFEILILFFWAWKQAYDILNKIKYIYRILKML